MSKRSAKILALASNSNILKSEENFEVSDDSEADPSFMPQDNSDSDSFASPPKVQAHLTNSPRKRYKPRRILNETVNFTENEKDFKSRLNMSASLHSTPLVGKLRKKPESDSCAIKKSRPSSNNEDNFSSKNNADHVLLAYDESLANSNEMPSTPLIRDKKLPSDAIRPNPQDGSIDVFASLSSYFPNELSGDNQVVTTTVTPVQNSFIGPPPVKSSSLTSAFESSSSSPPGPLPMSASLSSFFSTELSGCKQTFTSPVIPVQRAHENPTPSTSVPPSSRHEPNNSFSSGPDMSQKVNDTSASISNQSFVHPQKQANPPFPFNSDAGFSGDSNPKPSTPGNNSSHTEIPSAPGSSHASTSTPNRPPSSLVDIKDTINHVLFDQVLGRVISNYYEKNGELNEFCRNQLAELIILHELKVDPTHRISSFRFTQLSKAIQLRFPTEEPSVYYIPFHKDRLGNKHYAKGKLSDKLKNIKKMFVEQGYIAGRSKRAHDEEFAIEGDSDPVTEENIEWLKLNAQPWPEVTEKFRLTFPVRLERFRNSDQQSVSEYINTYPALSRSSGYALIEIDFKLSFPGKENKLYDLWAELETKLFDVANKFPPLKKKELEAFGINLNPPESEKAIHGLFIFSLLFPSVPVKKKWKPSKAELKDAFVLHVKTVADVKTRLEQRSRNLKKNNCPDQPVPLLVGDFSSGQFFVAINDVFYKRNSIIEAVDTCFKAYHILHCNYPPDSALPWTFLQLFVYDITTEWDITHPSYMDIRKKLNLLPKT